MRRATIILALASLVAALLVPTVVASHNMGHRYLFTGRLLDSAGMPVQTQDVTIRLIEAGNVVSSIVTTTDCHGDYDAWQGRRGSEGEPPRPGADGYGEIEEIESHNPPYVNFHFHGPHLSDRLKFRLTAAEEDWDAGFTSRTRQTIDLHQLGKTLQPSEGCGSFDAFNSTLTVRVFYANADEMRGVELPLKARTGNVTYDGVSTSGPFDFMFAYTARLQNVTMKDGGDVNIVATDLGSKKIDLNEQAVKFHRADSVNIAGESSGVSGGFLRTFGIIALGLVVIVGGFIGFNKIRDKMAEKRLRETTTRRRFRRGVQ